MRVTTKGQVTIPQHIREKLGITPSTEVDFVEEEDLFLAGKTYLKYKEGKGIRKSPLPDFYIGAQAAVLDLDLITRDECRYRTYFPTVRIICPE